MFRLAYKNLTNHKQLIIAAIILVFVINVFDILFIGSIAYSAKWLTCGEKPIVLADKTIYGQQSPSKVIYKNPNILRGKAPILNSSNSKLYCRANDIQPSNEDVYICDKDKLISSVANFGIGNICQ